MTLDRPPPDSPLRQNLRRLIMLRLIILAGVVVVTTVAQQVFLMDFSVTAVALVATLHVVNILLTKLRLSREWPVTEVEMLVQLSLDVALITAFLVFTGGASNPFVSLFLLPVVIAATVLPRTHAVILASAAVLCYSSLMIWGNPLTPPEHEHRTDVFSLHVMGMWINFLLCAGLVVWIVARMSAAIRERDRQLAQAREKNLRDDKALSLGLLAAGAAHELATPISTLSMLVKEMRHHEYDRNQWQEDLATLSAQVDHCRQVINGIAASAGQARSAQVKRLSLESFVLETLERWRLLRPMVPVVAHFDSGAAEPWVLANEALASTLTSLLNNAADASTKGVELRGQYERDHVIVEILDHGPGISEDVMQQAGRTIVTTKAEGKGWGIGLFLANISIERLGGSIVLLNRPEGGACTRVTVPLSSLQTTPA